MSGTAGEKIGRAYVDAVASKDAAGLLAVLHPELDFVGLTPRRTFTVESPKELVDDVVFGKWFEPSDVIERVDASDVTSVGPRHHLSYRFVIRNPDGHWLVEQQAYFDVTHDQIRFLRILCSGYQPLTD